MAKVGGDATLQLHVMTVCVPRVGSAVATTPVAIERKGVQSKSVGVDSDVDDGIVWIAIMLNEAHDWFGHISERRLQQMVE